MTPFHLLAFRVPISRGVHASSHFYHKTANPDITQPELHLTEDNLGGNGVAVHVSPHRMEIDGPLVEAGMQGQSLVFGCPDHDQEVVATILPGHVHASYQCRDEAEYLYLSYPDSALALATFTGHRESASEATVLRGMAEFLGDTYRNRMGDPGYSMGPMKSLQDQVIGHLLGLVGDQDEGDQ